MFCVYEIFKKTNEAGSGCCHTSEKNVLELIIYRVIGKQAGFPYTFKDMVNTAVYIWGFVKVILYSYLILKKMNERITDS